MTPYRVLLIEDDPLEAALARRTLRQIDKSIEVILLRDGAHFLQFYQKHRPVRGISLAIMGSSNSSMNCFRRTVTTMRDPTTNDLR